MANLQKERNEGLKTIQLVSDFANDRGLDEKKLIEEYGDIIIESGGRNHIYTNKYDELVHVRSKPVSRKKYRVKTSGKPKTNLENSDYPGLLIANITKKDEQIQRLATKKANLEKSLKRESNYLENSKIKLRLQKVTSELEQAKTNFQDWKDRLDDLLNVDEGSEDSNSGP